MWFLRTFIGSFYSPETYAKVRATPGNGFGYSILLVLLTTFVLTFYYGAVLNDAVFKPHNGKPPVFDDAVTQIARQLPVMTFKDNELRTQEPKQYDITVSVDILGEHMSGLVATIDTTGATTYETMKAPMLITSHEMVMRGTKKTEIKSFKEMTGNKGGTMLINHAMALDMANGVINYMHESLVMIYFWTGLVVWLMYIAVLYIQRMLMLVVLGLFGMLGGAMLRTPTPFDVGMRLAAVALTPVTVLTTLAAMLAPHPMRFWPLLVCGVVMLGVAMRVSRQTPLAEPVSFVTGSAC